MFTIGTAVVPGLCDRGGAEARFHKTSKLLADLAGGHADGTFTKRLAARAKAAVLVLDDFAMREFTAQQADDLYELVSQRITDGAWLIITANRAPRTGTGCSPTRTSQSPYSTGSSTPATRYS